MRKWTIILCLLVASLSLYAAPKRNVIKIHTFELPEQYSEQITQLAARYGIPLYIVCRLAKYESGWNKNAYHYNRDGTVDIGIYQLNSKYWHPPLVNAFDPVQSINVGIKYLAECIDKKPTLAKAIAAFQLGISGEESGWAKSTYKEVHYVLYEGIAEIELPVLR